jgi:hypothetical protein
MTSERTLELLRDLEVLGFDDRTFWRLHHFRERGHRQTIASHRKYCEPPREFQFEGTNGRGTCLTETLQYSTP